MKSSAPGREARAVLAEQTLEIIDRGAYTNAQGKTVTIRDEVEAAKRDSWLYRPAQLPTIREEAERLLLAEQTDATVDAPIIEVTEESTLEAARRLTGKQGLRDTLCLNFASAKNPGGGFMGGSQAQEESLARSSALYPCIAQMEEMYAHNRQLRTCLYSDYMIYSPKVPVFRDDRGLLLAEPYEVSIITAPAVNAGVVREREPHNIASIAPVMLDRIRYLLAVAGTRRERAIVLGAYGCGVFRNNPADVAAMFRQVLIEEQYRLLFDHVTFAIFDRSADQQVLHAFKAQFER
ncbi:uncharacterized protein (TIGR02452 family) [Paenibacillus phyllosphaerae]|uniref:Uncharacterized protein (TIGR02452 family) n=1 Tax=Paenibacillus phyllosphaerae TaxID=274593 RepID=A0A7W5FNG1_9BACL|nr:TIGR02452 family protein [Paenibacillus phyllosphaerae]MBB3111148.1 uncharacterized protein (TIGR02452 family) [Paenibacillus phyllosphaerae]